MNQSLKGESRDVTTCLWVDHVMRSRAYATDSETDDDDDDDNDDNDDNDDGDDQPESQRSPTPFVVNDCHHKMSLTYGLAGGTTALAVVGACTSSISLPWVE